MSFYEWDFIVSGSPAVSGGARTDIINAVKMLRWIKYKRSLKNGSVPFKFTQFIYLPAFSGSSWKKGPTDPTITYLVPHENFRTVEFWFMLKLKFVAM